MRASHNRALLAARADARSSIRPVRSDRPATNLASRVQTTVTPSGHVKRTTCAPLTPMQRNSEGRISEWNGSPNFWTDPAWSQTLSNQSDKR